MTLYHHLRKFLEISPERAISNLRADIARHAEKVLETGDRYAARRIFDKLAEIEGLKQVIGELELGRAREFEAKIENIMNQ